MKNNAIGIFDSGVGGLTVFLSLKKQLPLENFIYLADQKNCPYGRKSQKEIKTLSFKNVQFLIDENCKLIVIACNTITTGIINLLRKRFAQTYFVGVVPPVKPASEKTKTGHFVVLSTNATQKSDYLKLLINKFAKEKIVYNLPCSGLVELIEKGKTETGEIKKILEKCFSHVLKDNKVDIVVSGCTHYPFLKKRILSLFHQKIEFIEPSRAVANETKNILNKKKLLCKDRVGKPDRFFTTSSPLLFEKTLKVLTGLNIKADKLIL